MKRKAFTLIELLVVIAIIAILAAILFPVFAQAKDSAKKTADLSNQKQHVLCTLMYTNDYDDTAPLWMYNGNFDVDRGDRSLGNLIYAYLKSDDMHKTPNSPFSAHDREYDANSGFPLPSSKTGASVRNQELYNLGWLTDYGYNYQVFTGFFINGSGLYIFLPQSMTSGIRPANTIMRITGDFNRSASGGLLDGGQLPIDPPCEFTQAGQDTWVSDGNVQGYYYGGWQPTHPLAWNVFGGVWPYYNGPRASVGFLDGHAKTELIPQIAAGCNVQDGSTGFITDLNAYQWSLQF